MNEFAGKHTMMPPTTASSSLAIAQDKRPAHRSGGCAGILFQLFDWNRRFAKMKLFPKKLLPPVRPTKRVLKKFSVDEKMPMAKLFLIADENRGGFPNSKKPHEKVTQSSLNARLDNQMCNPGLVARLMGLESMPVVTQDKPRKAVDFLFGHEDSETFGSRHDLDLDLGMSRRGKHEPRPPKLQKTGFFERRPVSTRHGSEVLPFNKSVLSRTRKQHHKLSSPIKSPRLLCKKKSSRLMEAAVKILEPCQRNRVKTLTYLSSSQGNVEGNINSPSPSKASQGRDGTYHRYYQSFSKLEEVADLKSSTEKSSLVDGECSVSDFASTSSSHGPHNLIRPTSHACSNDGRIQSLTAQAKPNVHSRARNHFEGKPPSRGEHAQRKSRQDVGPRRAPRQNNVRQNQTSLARPNVYCNQQNRRDLNVTSNMPKDFISINRNLSKLACARTMPQASTTIQWETNRGTWDMKAMTHKRRPNDNSQIDVVKTDKPTVSKQRTNFGKTSEKRMGFQSSTRRNGPMHSRSRNVPNCNLLKQVENDPATTCNNTGIVSFTFNVPSRHDCPSVSSVEDLESLPCQEGFVRESASQAESLIIDSGTGKVSSQRVGTFTGDELTALLEQKIKELNSLDSGTDESLGKSTASILEELIFALTSRAPATRQGDDHKTQVSQMEGQFDNSPNASAAINNQCCSHNKMQEKAKRIGAAVLSTGSDCDQPSPVSILEVSFSTDSDLSECLMGNTGSKTYNGIQEESFDKSRSWDTDNDFLDSASSDNSRVDNVKSSASLESISIMYNNYPHEIGHVEEQKPSFVRELISNMELLSGNLLSHYSEGDIKCSIPSLLLDALASLLDNTLKNTSCNMISPDKLQFRQFLFDYMVEYLDRIYGCVCKSGYKWWKKLHLLSSSDKLSGEVYADICKWVDVGGKVLDDIIEKEMSHSSGKWVDFEFEGYEAGIDIEQDILQVLVDEIIPDLFPC